MEGKGSKRLLAVWMMGRNYLHAEYFLNMNDKIIRANAQYSARVDAFLNELAEWEEERLNRKPADGGWSAIQVVQHLILVETKSLGYVRKKLSFNPELKRAGLGAWWRMLALRFSVSFVSPFKFKAPQAVGNDFIPETATLESSRQAWANIRAEWSDFFAQMPPELTDKAVYRHPVAGRLNWLQMLDFLQAHFERHRRQALRAGKV